MPSHDGSYLAFRTDRDANNVRELQVLAVSAGDLVQVSDVNLNTGSIPSVAWSHMSDTLVYVADEDRQRTGVELISISPDGSGRTFLSLAGEDVRDSGSTTSVRMSPIGETVLYDYKVGNNRFMATVDLDGSNRHTITPAARSDFTDYAWAPDGLRIVYLDDTTLHSCNPDGSDNVEVTTTCVDFRWSVDGAALMYRDGPGGVDGNSLFICSPDGRDPLRVSEPPVGDSNVEPIYTSVLAPGGLYVVFVADTTVSNRPSIYVVGVGDDGPGKLQTLTKKEIKTRLKLSDGNDKLKSLSFRTFGDADSTFLELYVEASVCLSGSDTGTSQYFKIRVTEEPLRLFPVEIDVIEVQKLDVDSAGFKSLLIDVGKRLI
jgi:Tol biopolymer transport system component